MAGGYRVLVINPGSTSTQLALFEGEERLAEERTQHAVKELAAFRRIVDQEEFRFRLVEDFLKRRCTDGLDAATGRGGILGPLPSGVYEVNDAMLDDLRQARFGEHACNLGAILADRIARPREIPTYVADPPVVDELAPTSRITGLPAIQRRSIFHALNQKEVARRYARSLGRTCEELALVVCHLGGGVSVGVHDGGRVVWVNDALGGEGPFSAERAGGLPAVSVLELAFSGRYTREELEQMMSGKGGLVAHLGTNDLRRAMADGSPEARVVIEALALQAAREISAGLAVLARLPDAVIITGNMAKSERLVELISGRLEGFMEVVVMPGSFEAEALAAAAARVLSGVEEARKYPPDG